MKTLKLFLFSSLFILFAQLLNAQTQTSAFKVAGECGMCKKKIETAAKNAGATYATWDVTSKALTVKYDSKKANEAKIQESIAAVGYDTPKYKATDEAYEKLHECCKYERISKKANCCDGASCSKEECQKCCADGKCTTGMDCCKDGKCSKEAHSAHAAKSEPACCTKS
ncbi:MAG TPA: heavy-metal-associated domain-containing protein [Flavisolibacter sp.]|nr:heavy-metal-associated domain-containing protein [Flavisolibacter sp.]